MSGENGRRNNKGKEKLVEGDEKRRTGTTSKSNNSYIDGLSIDDIISNTSASSLLDDYTPGGRYQFEEDNQTQVNDDGSIVHIIRKNETLEGIALKYGVKVADIKKENKIIASTDFYARRSLNIPTAETLARKPTPQIKDEKEHAIQQFLTKINQKLSERREEEITRENAEFYLSNTNYKLTMATNSFWADYKTGNFRRTNSNPNPGISPSSPNYSPSSSSYGGGVTITPMSIKSALGITVNNVNSKNFEKRSDELYNL
eukprot:TRINITY_DN16747_c0_g1_i1.p1 TRINITY_DN16747_c0_g1~~TRINITY_DN16747_c0_g1_i1.p1  ORF type:complete len:259 (+),score=86.66 TRINITY_DN16747_c0_g1_i1:22-798(+)